MITEADLPLHGGCACGKVRYQLTETPLFTHACHCIDCQRSTGSAFVIHTLTTEEGFVITGDTKSTTLPTGSGAGYDPHFCVTCGTFVWCQYHRAVKGFIVVRTGTLDQAYKIAPQAHVFTKQKLSWLALPSNIPCFDEFYDAKQTWPTFSNEKLANLVQKYSA